MSASPESLLLVFAPDALVRFRNGRMLIHTTSSTLPAFESDQPALLAWLGQFARPVPVRRAVAALPQSEHPAAARVLDYLQRAGVLVPADASAAEPTADEASIRTKQHLKLLARSVYDAACDLHGLGPEAERALAANTGIGVERRLMALLAGLDGLRQELAALRRPYVTTQLDRLGVTPQSRDLKLHIGCGPGRIDGWINMDVHPAPLALNVLWGLPFASGSARCVFVSHLLEHLFFPADVRPFLGEIRRVLAPGGVVRIVVPDVEQCIAAYATGDRSFFASRRETWSWWPEDATRLEDFLAYSGVGAEPAHLFESHKYGYDFETLARELDKAGFTQVERSTYMGSRHEALRVDDASAVAKAKYGERYYSLFIEASCP
ncbi:MAG TPA: methyltransferase domain-containing protein [Steroidobacteraceae bacterium]|nr:methyltransferase domain-containing protein [Steroidobacteraceae bacterium]